jgi:hypothetical protein
MAELTLPLLPDEEQRVSTADELILPPLPSAEVQANARLAASNDPEKFAKIKRVSEQLAIPIETVERNFDSLDSEAKVREMNARMIADPFYADRMRDPNFARLSQGDDLSLTGVAKSIASLPWRAVQGVASGLPSLTGGLAGTVAAGAELASEYVGKPLAGKLLPEDIFAKIGQKYRQIAIDSQKYAERVADVPTDAGIVHRSLMSGFQSLGANLPPMITAMYTGNAPLALTLMSASSGGQSYARGREAGLTPLRAAEYGLNDAGWEYLTEVLPFTKLLGDLKAGSPFIKAFMHNQVSEQLGEQVATVMQDFDEWVFLNPDKPFSDYVAARPSAALQTAIATAIGSGGQVSILYAMQTDAQRKEARANADAEALKEMLSHATESLLRERSPETFTQFVAAAAAQGPIDSVYVDATVFAQEAQKAGIDLARAMPETAAAINDAVATRSDVRIPISEFATAVPGTTMEQSIIPFLKTDADGATQQEISDKKWVEETQRETERVLAEHDFNDAWKKSTATVKQELLTQLSNANRFTADVNNAYASLMSAFYATQANRIGITPEEMYVRYPLRIQAQAVAPDTAAVLEQRVSIRPRQPDAVSVKAIHFSNAPGLSTLSGSRFGTGLSGAEQRRLAFANDKRLQRRVYFYLTEGGPVRPESGLGPHKYRVTLDNMYDFSTDPRGVLPQVWKLYPQQEDRLNAMESMVIDMGFDGYIARQTGAAVVLNADVPVEATQGATVNIGLKVGETDSITPEEALAALKSNGVTPLQSAVHVSDTEPTLVATLSRPLTDSEAYNVALDTRQQAIAQFAGGEGQLHGPEAAAWGAFNPQFFLTLDGKRLSETTYHQETVPAEWVYSELTEQVKRLQVPEAGLTPAEWRKRIFEPAGAKTVAVRDAKNRPTGETRTVETPARVLLPGVKLGELEASGLMDWFTVNEEAITDFVKTREYETAGVHVLESLGVFPEFTIHAADGKELAGGFATREDAKAFIESKKKLAATAAWQAFDANGESIGTFSNREAAEKDLPRGGHVVEIRPTSTITKQEVLDYLTDKGVQIEETILTAEGTEPEEREQFGEVEYDEGRFNIEDPDDEYISDVARENYYDDILEKILEDEYEGVDISEVPEDEREAVESRAMEKAEHLALQNYYEDEEAPHTMTVTVSQDGVGSVEYTVSQAYGETNIHDENGREVEIDYDDRRRRQPNIQSSILQHAMEYHDIYERDDEDIETREGQVQYANADYNMPGGQDYFELLLSLPGKSVFRAGHFGDVNVKNILGWVRAATRVTADGKRVLFIEEIQSDWAQRGREEGFTNVASEKLIAELREKRYAEQQASDLLFENQKAPFEAARDEARNAARDEFAEEIQAAKSIFETATIAAQHAYDSALDAASKRLAAAPPERNLEAQEIRRQEVSLARQQYNAIYEPAEAAYRNTYEPAYQKKEARLQAANDIYQKEKNRLAAERSVRNEEIAARYAAQIEDVEKRFGKSGSIVPHAFVKRTDAWVSLVAKRILRYAAENDFDRVAWTRGDQQVQRWQNALRKRVDFIEWEKTKEGVHLLGFKGPVHRAKVIENVTDGTFSILDTDGNEFILANTLAEAQAALDSMPANLRIGAGADKVVDTTYAENQISDAIGKAMGEQIRRDPNQTGTIIGENIKIDDIGMSQFYGDENGLKGDGTPSIMGKIFNDLLKRYASVTTDDLLGKVTTAPKVAATDANLPASRYRLHHNSNGSWSVLDVSSGSEVYTALSAESAATRLNQLQSDIASAQPGFEVTPELKAASLKPFPLFQGKRGQITFGTDIKQQPTVITLLQNADLSTFLHESGHFYLEVMADLATQPTTPLEVMQDFVTTLNWFGVTPEQWRAMSMEQRRPYHEKWARGFESYLFEGRAPSLETQSLFSRFRAWLLNVYRQLTGLNVELTQEVRQVMDRLLATNDEIVRAETARSYAHLFETKPPGMTDAEWAEYQRLGTEATQAAVDTLQSRSMRDMQYASNAKDRVLARLQREASEKRSGVRAEVAAEVYSEPIYQVVRFLRTGQMTTEAGEDIRVEAGHRLDKAALAEMYPATALANPDLSRLTRMVGPNGIHPNLLAEMFGFGSGDELARKLADVEPARSKIDGLTDQRMLERYGDLSSTEAMERAANAAIHNDVRARFVATELRTLDKAVGQRSVLIKAAKDYAGVLISRKKVRALRPSTYENAEARAARAAESAILAGDTVAAAAQKRNQLVNLYAAKATYDAQEEVDKGVAYLKKAGGSAAIDPAYREQITTLLERFDLHPVSERAAQKRHTLAQWIEAQRSRGLEPVIDPFLENEAYRKPYQDMSVEEFRGLVDAVRNIEHLGRLKTKLLNAQEQRRFDTVVKEIVDSINANAKRTVPVRIEQNSWTDRARRGTLEFLAMHRKFASFMREMDGYSDSGILQRLLVHTSNAAGANEAVMHEQATIKLSELFKAIRGPKMSEKMHIPAINQSLSREGRIMVALNAGNEGNLQRMMDGDHWTLPQVQAVIDTLTKPEMDFVQAVWDFVGSYRQQIGEQQRRLTGLEPQWVEPRQVITRHGAYAGGYLPVKYDVTRSTRSLSDEAAAGLIDAWRAKRGIAHARASFTKERAEKVVDRPIRKDFGVITQHITEVTHRLAWQDWLVDANRLLRAPGIDAAVREHYGPETLQSIRNAIEDIAAGHQPGQNTFERAINHLRTGATIAGLGWRLTTSMLQPIGLTQSMVRIGTKWVGRGLLEWMGDAAHMENTVKRIGEKSDFMRLRAKTLQREIAEIRDIVGDRNSAIEASYFYLIQKMQLIADVPTWLGQYHKAIDAGADEKLAVAQADQAVLDAQGGGQIKDLAAIQRGGPLLKLFTNFYSFFNTTFNLTSEAVGRTDFRKPGQIGLLAVDFLMLYSVPAALGTLMKWALSDKDDEDELLRQLIADQLTFLFGTMVGIRELAGAIRVAAGLPGDYTGPASLRVINEVTQLTKQVGQGEADEAFWKALNQVGGIIFHYPSGQINDTADGIVSMADGRTHHPGALVSGTKK